MSSPNPNFIEQYWITKFEAKSLPPLEFAQPERLFCATKDYRKTNVKTKVQAMEVQYELAQS